MIMDTVKFTIELQIPTERLKTVTDLSTANILSQIKCHIIDVIEDNLRYVPIVDGAFMHSTDKVTYRVFKHK